jgi:dihydroorotate dehydrogenase (fumarate)
MRKATSCTTRRSWGALTVSHLRFGPKPISYLVSKANFVACHQWIFMERYDMLSALVPGGTFLLNSPFGPDPVWDHLPRVVQEQLVLKKAKLFVIDAFLVARDTGIGSRMNTILRVCFFAISKVLPRDEAVEAIHNSIRDTYGKKGNEIVQKNMKAVDETLAHLFEVRVPERITSTIEMPPPFSAGAPTFERDFPQASEFRLGPEGYLENIRKAKEAVDIPVIASLNGAAVSGWAKFAKEIEQAGADALECNIYYLPTDPNLKSADVEQTYIDIAWAVKSAISIPVAVKISPFFSNLANMAKRLDETGANGLVLFNRFYQPDIDLDELEIRPNVLLSTPQALRLPLTWIGIPFGRVQATLAATSGVHDPQDVIKLLMVGANVTMLCSSLLRNGINHLRHMERGISDWMEQHEYESVRQMQGSMSQLRCPDPSAFERAQYMRAVKSLRHVLARG